jgi:hypothetical protein
MVFITPLFGTYFQSRVSSGGLSTSAKGASSAASPYWLKLERRGSAFNGYGAADGTNWTLLSSVTIPMAATIYAGLAVSAHNNALLSTATFDNIQLAHPAAPIPLGLSISRLPGAGIQLTITGVVGLTYCCEASTNLISWMPITTNLNTSGTIQIQLPRSGRAAWNCFRVLALP